MNWSRCGMAAVLCATAAAQSIPEAQELDERGNAAMEQHRPDEGVRYLRQSVEMFRTLGSGSEAGFAGALTDLGYALAEEGKRQEAIENYKQALAIQRRVLGETHLRTVANMNLLASAYLMSGDTGSAEPLLSEVIAIAREHYPGSIQLSEALGGLSHVLSRQGKLHEAQVAAAEALAVSLAREGEDSINSAMMYAILAEVHRLAGEDARALPLFRKARAIYEKMLEPDHPRLASVLSQEGLILLNDNQITLAERAMTRALEILERSCPGCVTEAWIAESNLALVRMAQKRYIDADRLLSHVLSVQEKYLPRPGRETVQTLQTLALVREKERRHAEAVLLIKRANTLLAYQ